jgi:hypothetical protein
MKHNKSIFAIVLFTAFSFFATPLMAGHDTANLPVELKFLGNVKNQPLVELSFSGSKTENEFTISITDQHGIILYSSNERGEKFSKQFLLDTDDLGDATLTFRITGKKSGRSASYKVSHQSVTIENMDVVRL